MLTQAWFPLNYHPIQARVWRDSARFKALACGRGSGKTELSRRYVVRMLPVKKKHHDPPMYFYALPTREQARRIAWEKLKALVPDNWVVGSPRESDLVIKTVFGSSLHLVGMDKPHRIEGNQWDGGIVDESCDQKPGHFDRSIRPALSHKSGFCWRIGVPKRFGCGASDFRKCWLDWGKLGAGYASYTWPSHDILSPEEIQDAARSLDQKDFDEQYGAIWQGTSGLVFYAFDEALNVDDKITYDPNKPIIVGSDFNVSPMAWVVCQQLNPGKPHLHCVDEIWLKNSNTQQALDMLYKRYPNHDAGWIFFGDATAQSRKTSATSSDYAQIQNDQRFVRKKIHYPKANPPRADRFAACNRLFCNALGERRFWASPRCKNLIHDLTSRAYVPGEKNPDDHDDIGHITDALGYIIWRVWPVIPTSQTASTVLVGAA